jgi:hypothetical protein
MGRPELHVVKKWIIYISSASRMATMEKEDYDYFLELDLTPYGDEWIAICGRKVIAHALSFREAHAQALKVCGGKRPLMARAHSEEYLIL